MTPLPSRTGRCPTVTSALLDKPPPIVVVVASTWSGQPVVVWTQRPTVGRELDRPQRKVAALVGMQKSWKRLRRAPPGQYALPEMA
jgi:hypothetical protein